MVVNDVSQKYDVIIRNFKNLKYQNILAFTIRSIVRITPLTLQNCQFGRLAANNTKLHFRPLWSNVTYSPDSPVNFPIESGNVRKKMVQCHRTEFIKCNESLLSTSYRLTAGYKWHHTKLL